MKPQKDRWSRYLGLTLTACFTFFSSLVCALEDANILASAGIMSQLDAIETSSIESELAVKALLEQTQGMDKVKVKLKLASIYRNSSQQRLAEDLLEEIDKDVIKFDDKELKISAILSRAKFEHNRNNYIKAAELAESQALPLAFPDSPQLPSLYRQIGLFYRYQMKLVEAKKYYFLALEHYQNINDEDGMASLYGNIGVLYETFGDLALASKYQQKARVIFEKNGNKTELATNYYNLGELYYRSGEIDKALEYFLRALDLDIEINNMQDVGYDHHRISTIYMLQNNLTLASQHTNEAIKIFVNVNANQVLSRAYIQQAKIYFLMDMPEQQLASLKLGKQAALKSASEHQLRAALNRFGEYYLQQNDLPQALDFGQKAMALSNKLSLSVYQYEDNKLLATVYYKMAGFEKAHDHLLRAFEIEQQLNSDQQIKELEKYKRDLNLLEEQVKVTKLEQQQSIQKEQLLIQKESSRRNNFMFVVAVVLLGLLAFLLSQRRKMALIEAKLYEDALQQKNQLLADVSHELRTPLTALKLQVDALQHRIVKDVDVSYQKLSTKVMDINRLISDIYELAKAETGEVTLAMESLNITDELSAWQPELKDFVEGQGFSWQLEMPLTSIPVRIDSERIKQVLFNILSNSCFYTDKPGIIEMVVKANTQWAFISINDSSPGVERKELSKIFDRLYRVEKSRNRQTGGSGLGLSICKSLINAHGGDIIAKPSPMGGLSVKIRLPIVIN